MYLGPQYGPTLGGGVYEGRLMVQAEMLSHTGLL